MSKTTQSKYRFGFILSTSLGNTVAYRNLRKYAERDPDIACTFAPVKHFYAPDEHDPVAWVPRPFYSRAVVIRQAWPVLGNMRNFDAVMIHSFEVMMIAAIRSLIRKSPPVFARNDNPPMVDPDNYPVYPEMRSKPAWRQRLRLGVDRWTARHTPYAIPFSTWQAGILVEGCGIPSERVTPIHVGIDLESWPKVERKTRNSGPVKLLFVGNDFDRKGGRLLLDLFANGLVPGMTLDIVSNEDIGPVPAGVMVHKGVTHAGGRLQAMYADADIFVLPTTADYSSWVALEALACGCPVIASNVGGIPDLVRHGRTGLLIPPNDPAALREALSCLASDPAKRAAMSVQSRHIAEGEFSAAVNVPRMMTIMKHATEPHESM